MRAIIEVLRSIGLWLLTGGVRLRPIMIVLPPMDVNDASERRFEERTMLPERRVAGRL